MALLTLTWTLTATTVAPQILPLGTMAEEPEPLQTCLPLAVKQGRSKQKTALALRQLTVFQRTQTLACSGTVVMFLGLQRAVLVAHVLVALSF